MTATMTTMTMTHDGDSGVPRGPDCDDGDDDADDDDADDGDGDDRNDDADDGDGDGTSREAAQSYLCSFLRLKPDL